MTVDAFTADIHDEALDDSDSESSLETTWPKLWKLLTRLARDLGKPSKPSKPSKPGEPGESSAITIACTALEKNMLLEDQFRLLQSAVYRVAHRVDNTTNNVEFDVVMWSARKYISQFICGMHQGLGRNLAEFARALVKAGRKKDLIELINATLKYHCPHNHHPPACVRMREMWKYVIYGDPTTDWPLLANVKLNEKTNRIIIKTVGKWEPPKPLYAIDDADESESDESDESEAKGAEGEGSGGAGGAGSKRRREDAFDEFGGGSAALTRHSSPRFVHSPHTRKKSRPKRISPRRSNRSPKRSRSTRR